MMSYINNSLISPELPICTFIMYFSFTNTVMENTKNGSICQKCLKPVEMKVHD